jgi:NAD(H)-dependent 7beta-hydroxy-3-oxo-delta4-cholenoic acid oxidoreductase
MDADNTVTMVEMLAELAHEETAGPRTLLMQRLREKGVTTITSATVKEITDDGAVIERDGREETIRGMDQIVLACGTRSVDVLSGAIGGTVPEVHVVGDAKRARTALEAIAEGCQVGRTI